LDQSLGSDCRHASRRGSVAVVIRGGNTAAVNFD
jgi:hypothetical protein